MQNSIEKSKVHGLFFVKTTRSDVFDLTYSDYWDKKLGEKGTDVLLRCAREGLIETAPIDVVIDKKFTIDQLKPHLKERGLKVGGKKSEMVSRIIETDPSWAQNQNSSGSLYRRTSIGNSVASEIHESIGRE
ncbi:MAG: SAP domain-containing protein [Sulfurimicrobium sp.]|nr:SAP domain-containing protein [Sulfurimicrobium sp.]